MINFFSFWWRQLNGSQITAFFTATFNYIKSTIDTVMDYWNDFSIATATSAHLTLIGCWQGIARPLVSLANVAKFWFSEVPEEGTYYPSVPYTESSHGLSAIDNMGVGGKFDEVDPEAGAYNQINASLFRAILRASSNSKGSPGSLVWLDDVLYGMWRCYNSVDDAEYTIKMLTLEDIATMVTRSAGDLYVNIGSESKWGDTASVLAELGVLSKTLYYPTPTIYAVANI